MQQLIASSVADRRAVLILMAAFTGAALFLGTVGIYGVTAHGVRSRSRELSIRIALGASRRNVVGEVLAGGLLVTAGGVLAGLVGALALARLVEGFLYDVTSSDRWALGTAATFAALVSILATWIPAGRSANADPVDALATE